MNKQKINFTQQIETEQAEGTLEIVMDSALMTDTLKNISMKEATLFVRHCSHIISASIGLLKMREVGKYEMIRIGVLAYDHMHGLGLEPQKSVSCGDLAKAIIETEFSHYLEREYKPADQK